jgi:hypothetical protein
MRGSRSRASQMYSWCVAPAAVAVLRLLPRTHTRQAATSEVNRRQSAHVPLNTPVRDALNGVQPSIAEGHAPTDGARRSWRTAQPAVKVLTSNRHQVVGRSAHRRRPRLAHTLGADRARARPVELGDVRQGTSEDHVRFVAQLLGFSQLALPSRALTPVLVPLLHNTHCSTTRTGMRCDHKRTPRPRLLEIPRSNEKAQGTNAIARSRRV